MDPITIAILAAIAAGAIVQGFFCNFDQVLPRNFILRSI